MARESLFPSLVCWGEQWLAQSQFSTLSPTPCPDLPPHQVQGPPYALQTQDRHPSSQLA